MPALALPLVVPFAEAVGITAVGLGIIELSKKVNEYIQEFPEESIKILATIMPEQGIAALFNEAAEGEGDEEVEVEGEVEEEDLTKLSGKEKGKKFKEEAQKKTGSYQDPDAIGNYASKRGRMIKMAERLGLADPKLKDKPYKKSGYDWKKWTRKADGGRIGFVVGGLSEQDQSIYDAWLRAGHSKEDVMAFLASRGLDSTDTGIESIVNVQPNIIDQGGGGGGGPLGTQISDFRTSVNPDDIDDTEIKQPGKFKTFIDSGINKLRESKLGQMAGSALGFLGDLPGAGIVTGMVDKMDRFDELPQSDQEFITSMMGYSDPDTNRGNVDPFGINTRSLFGNYADYVRKTNQKLAGREFKPGSWQAQRQQFYNIQENERIRQENERIRQEKIAAEKARQADLANIRAVEQYTGQPMSQYRRDRPASERQYTGHGRSGMGRDPRDRMADGGLATMFERRR